MWISLVIEIITLAIKYGPEIAALVKEIVDRIRQVRNPDAKKAFAGDLAAAYSVYRVSKDRRPLLNLLVKIHEAVAAQ